MNCKLVSLVLAGLMVIACGQYEARYDGALDEAEMPATMMASRAPMAPPAEEAVPRRREAAPAQVPVPTERKVIRHGNLSLEVESVEGALTTVKRMVESREGYISNESVSEDPYGRKSGSIFCRIPSEDLDEVIEQIKGLGKVESTSVAADDITDQYYDLEIRIENQKKLEERLADLLQRQTNKLSDLLEIEREMARVRTEIDSMEGRKRLWDNQVAFSTLVVNLHEPVPTIAGEEGGALRTLLRSFGEAGNNFVLTVAGIIAASGAVVPLALVLGVVVWLVFKAMKRRKGRTRKTTDAEDESDRSEK